MRVLSERRPAVEPGALPVTARQASALRPATGVSAAIAGRVAALVGDSAWPRRARWTRRSR